MATVRGDSDSAQYKISSAPDRDDWDTWNSDRDHMIRNAGFVAAHEPLLHRRGGP